MNKIEVIQFFIADSAVLFFHVRIISRTPWTNFRYKGYFCRLIGQRQRITYLFSLHPRLVYHSSQWRKLQYQEERLSHRCHRQH